MGAERFLAAMESGWALLVTAEPCLVPLTRITF